MEVFTIKRARELSLSINKHNCMPAHKNARAHARASMERESFPAPTSPVHQEARDGANQQRQKFIGTQFSNLPFYPVYPPAKGRVVVCLVFVIACKYAMHSGVHRFLTNETQRHDHCHLAVSPHTCTPRSPRPCGPNITRLHELTSRNYVTKSSH